MQKSVVTLHFSAPNSVNDEDRKTNNPYPQSVEGRFREKAHSGFLLNFGWAGIHRFYVGKVVSGVIYLLTFGLFGFGWFIDLFLLSGYVDTYNALHMAMYGMRNNNMNANANNIVINMSGQAQAPNLTPSQHAPQNQPTPPTPNSQASAPNAEQPQ